MCVCACMYVRVSACMRMYMCMVPKKMSERIIEREKERETRVLTNIISKN